MDPSRTGPVQRPDPRPRRLGSAPDPVEEWLRYALDARVMMIRATPDRFVPIDGPLGSGQLTFAAWMQRGHELGWPTLDDFEYHLTTLFPPVRPRGWLELRMIDALPDPWWRVAAAVTTALLEDGDAGAAALEAVSAPPPGQAWPTTGAAPPATAWPTRPCGRRPSGCSRRRSTRLAASASTAPRWPPPKPSTSGSWPGACARPTNRRGSPTWSRSRRDQPAFIRRGRARQMNAGSQPPAAASASSVASWRRTRDAG